LVRPIVGTIRWDAFYGSGVVPKAVERSLGPAKYHHRAPFFAKVTGKNSLSINGDKPEILAREIGYAAQAGVYWAFLTYSWDSDLTRPLRMFLTHPDREKVRFTLILSNHALDDKQWADHFRDTLRKAASMVNFQTVLGGRPLVYTFFGGKEGRPSGWEEKRRRRLEEICTMLLKETGKEPYLVHFMHGIPQADWPKYKKLGYDASTLYAHFAQKHLTYAQFQKIVERSWDSWARKRYPHVPLLSAGWDNRPRYDNPVPWVKKQESMLTRYAESPTPKELAAHFKAGMDYVYKNPEVCAAQSLMVYAWNEHDEGGWLCPTLDPKTGKADDSRVRAVGDAIRNWRPPR